MFTIANLCFIFLFSFNYVLSHPHHQNVPQLVFTSILYRHGIRNPESLYETDPYKSLKFWPEGLGMLINSGKLQHYILGQWLRTRYISLIPDGEYNHNLAFIRSSDMDRTLMSAQANLAGMFYPTKEEMWSGLAWQPIPVHTVPQELDKIIKMGYSCPKINREKKAVKRLPIVRKFKKHHKDIYKYLTKNMGERVNNPKKTGRVYFTLLIEKLRNYTIPSWTNDVFPDKMYSIATFNFQMKTMTKTLKRLKGGPLLKDMITNMVQKRNGTLSPNRNIFIYSGHDTTIAALLDTMGVFEPHVPPFAATVMVELRKDVNEDFFVSVHYKNTTEEPTLLTIPGCTPSCPLDKFQSLLSDVIPEDWDKECQLSDEAVQENGQTEGESEYDDE